MEKFNNILKLIIRIGIGVFFIVSAILKLLGLEHFELYIYSFKLFNLTLSGLVARAIIASEILVGLLLIIKVRYKEAWWFTLLMLIGFSLLLVYVILFRNDSNCHCMGELFEIKPSISLIKNLVTIVLLFFIRNEEDYHFRGRIVALVVAFLAALVPPFFLFPIDNVYNAFSKPEIYDEASLHALMQDSVMLDVKIDEGNYIVGIVSSGCDFCRTSCLKMSEIAANNELDSTRIVYWIWGDSTSNKKFPSETQTEAFKFVEVNPLSAVRITNSFPLYLFFKDGEVVKTANLRQLTEKDVKNHLQ
jgi:uncharacterized membrane protein YphA (DoxX/SURF4 family)